MDVSDTTGEYFRWRRSVDLARLPGEAGQKKLAKQKLAVANRMLQHASINIKATPKFKMPVNREIEIINKWKLLDQADQDLALERKKYKANIRSLGRRWEAVERGQQELRDNLVRYNNFIKEKQSKVASGNRLISTEKGKQIQLTGQARQLEVELATARAGRELLAAAVEHRAVFPRYLAAVLAAGGQHSRPVPAHCGEELLERAGALVAGVEAGKARLAAAQAGVEQQEEGLAGEREAGVRRMLERTALCQALQRERDRLAGLSLHHNRNNTDTTNRLADKR